VALPWLLLQLSSGAIPTEAATAIGPPPWGLIGYGTSGEAVIPPIREVIEDTHDGYGWRPKKRRKHKSLREILAELRREEDERYTPAKAKTAQEAVRRAENAAARAADEVDLDEATELARAVMLAQNASRASEAVRLANEAMAMANRILRQIEDDDDDDVSILMLMGY
jgi:hypothetical protein